MKLLVIAGEAERKRLDPENKTAGAPVEWAATLPTVTDATCVIDLLFDGTAERCRALATLQVPLVMVNAVTLTGEALPAGFIRFNGWPGFLERPVTEAACPDEPLKTEAAAAFAVLGKKITWTPDVPGFVAARIVAMIINEAWLALEEGVSTAEEIDTAMQLGTNYPQGPFAWGRLIGLPRVLELLQSMQREHERYRPAPLLLTEAARA